MRVTGLHEVTEGRSPGVTDKYTIPHTGIHTVRLFNHIYKDNQFLYTWFTGEEKNSAYMTVFPNRENKLYMTENKSIYNFLERYVTMYNIYTHTEASS